MRVPRQWTKYEYHDPNVVLPKLHGVRRLVSVSDLPENVKNLRTHSLQPEREAWDAAIFCYLLSRALNLDIRFSRVEELDFDSVFTWLGNGVQNFAPVQMKELVPEFTNANATLDQIIAGLRKYVDSSELVVGIKLNRQISIDFSAVDVSGLPVAEVWLFGATAEDQSKWSLFGRKGGQWVQYEYELPNA